VFLTLAEREMLAYSLDTMNRASEIDELVLVVREEDRSMAERVISETGLSKLIAVVAGGDSRHQSEWHGLEALASEIESGEIEIVAIHDGARPFMTTEILHATIEAARQHGGGVPGMPIDGPVYERTEDGTVALPHQRLRRMQTPQSFRAGPLLAAYRQAASEGREGVDTAETATRYSDLAIEVVPGDPRNIKVTFVEDIFRAEEYAAAFARGAWTD
jgi:2-C-methyl-D-erythritol 4-phosphate cytidylyltransferase